MKLKAENINETRSRNVNEAKGIKRKLKQKKEQKKMKLQLKAEKWKMP